MNKVVNEGKEKFCNNLRELRRLNNYAQSDVAFMLKIPISTYANWEQGRRDPSISDIYAIIKLYDIEPNELFD
ncbi:MAG: helix-turn-helix transcriptional regulator [Clostridia bacterium]|jgi:transcriptional regulator with XRE-family HTH domain|nr:helix-turn-helix transcriptional regulator [Clostridia bacterium]